MRIRRNQPAQSAIEDICPNLAVRERIDRAQLHVCPTALDSDTAFHHAKSLAAEGASVVVNYASSKPGADTVVSDITGAGGKAIAVRGNVSKAAEAQGIIDAAIKNFGHLDILVNNWGVYEFSPIESFTEEHYNKIFNFNVLGYCSPHRPQSSTLAKAPAASTSVLSSAA